MTVDPEQVCTLCTQVGEIGTVGGIVGIIIYVVSIGTVLLLGGAVPTATLDINTDPVVNALISQIGASITLMCVGLALLTNLRKEPQRDIVTILSGIGIGFGAAAVRYSLPVVLAALKLE